MDETLEMKAQLLAHQWALEMVLKQLTKQSKSELKQLAMDVAGPAITGKPDDPLIQAAREYFDDLLTAGPL